MFFTEKTQYRFIKFFVSYETLPFDLFERSEAWTGVFSRTDHKIDTQNLSFSTKRFLLAQWSNNVRPVQGFLQNISMWKINGFSKTDLKYSMKFIVFDKINNYLMATRSQNGQNGVPLAQITKSLLKFIVSDRTFPSDITTFDRQFWLNKSLNFFFWKKLITSDQISIINITITFLIFMMVRVRE